MMVSTQNVDQQVTTRVLLLVICNVWQKIGGVAIGLDENPVLIVAELAGSQPCRTLGLVDESAFGQDSQRRLNRTRLRQTVLRCPMIELSVHRCQHFNLVDVSALSPPSDRVCFGGHLLGPFADVGPEITTLGRIFTSLAGRQRRPEQRHLLTPVVHVELSGHVIGAALEQASQRIAIGRPTTVPRMQRAGRVSRHVLNVDRRSRANSGPGKTLRARVHDAGQNIVATSSEPNGS